MPFGTDIRHAINVKRYNDKFRTKSGAEIGNSLQARLYNVSWHQGMLTLVNLQVLNIAICCSNYTLLQTWLSGRIAFSRENSHRKLTGRDDVRISLSSLISCQWTDPSRWILWVFPGSIWRCSVNQMNCIRFPSQAYKKQLERNSRDITRSTSSIALRRLYAVRLNKRPCCAGFRNG